MAIGNGSYVTPGTIIGTAGATFLDGSPWLAQPPIVGRCSGAGGGNVNVLWDNGGFASTVPSTSLVELGVAGANSLDFSGQVVRRLSNNQSGEFIGVPVLIASIALTAGGALSDFAIIKSNGPSNHYWAALISDLEVVAGQ